MRYSKEYIPDKIYLPYSEYTGTYTMYNSYKALFEHFGTGNLYKMDKQYYFTRTNFVKTLCKYIDSLFYLSTKLKDKKLPKKKCGIGYDSYILELAREEGDPDYRFKLTLKKEYGVARIDVKSLYNNKIYSLSAEETVDIVGTRLITLQCLYRNKDELGALLDEKFFIDDVYASFHTYDGLWSYLGFVDEFHLCKSKNPFHVFDVTVKCGYAILYDKQNRSLDLYWIDSEYDFKDFKYFADGTGLKSYRKNTKPLFKVISDEWYSGGICKNERLLDPYSSLENMVERDFKSTKRRIRREFYGEE